MKNFKVFLSLSVIVLVLLACEEEKSGSDAPHANNDTTESNEDDTTSGTINPKALPEAILDESYHTIYEQTSGAFQSEITPGEFEDLGKDFNKDVNSYELTSVLQIEGMTEYQWLSGNGTEGIRTYFADDDTIEGLQFIPVTAKHDSDNEWTENTYRMPFRGEWMTYWGGVNELVNYHYAAEVQRYAYDLLVMADGMTHDGNASDNESYFAYGESVLAPREGEVVAMEDNIEDNTPTVDTNEGKPFGNHVILKHENDEYSVMAHMKKETVSVEEGDTVEAGEALGKVGNSGNSSEPHIHFQVSDSQDFEEMSSIRIQFESDKNPVRGDKVSGFPE